MPQPNLPKSSGDLAKLKAEAEGQMIGGTVKSALTFAVGASVLEASRPLAPKSVDKIAHYGFGGKFKPVGPGQRLRPTPFALLYLAPAPIGIAPPEFYNLRPDYLGRAFPFLPKSELLATSASAERSQYADAAAARRDILTLQSSVQLASSSADLERIVGYARRQAAAHPYLADAVDEVERAAARRASQLNSASPLMLAVQQTVSELQPPAEAPEPLRQRAPVGGIAAALARRIQAANPIDPPLG